MGGEEFNYETLSLTPFCFKSVAVGEDKGMWVGKKESINTLKRVEAAFGQQKITQMDCDVLVQHHCD